MLQVPAENRVATSNISLSYPEEHSRGPAILQLGK